MENNKPKFRLEDITFLPAGISDIINDIISEFSPKNNKLRPALVLNEVCVPYTGPCATQSGEFASDYSCDPFCSCNTEPDCANHCGYCRCVDHDPCPSDRCVCVEYCPGDDCGSYP